MIGIEKSTIADSALILLRSRLGSRIPLLLLSEAGSSAEVGATCVSAITMPRHRQ